MRILTALNIGYPVVGGAQRTHQTYLRGLARAYGHTCFYLDAARTRRAIRHGAVQLDFFRDDAELFGKIKRARPDAIIAGFTLIHDAVKMGHALDIPVVGWMNSYEYCPPTAQEIQAWHLTHGHRYPAPAERAFALQHADALVVNSRFVQARLERMTGARAQVIYPAFDAREILFSPRAYTPAYILGICGYPHKGADIFWELARRFPQQSFLLAGAVHADYMEKFRALENVTHVAFTPIRALLRHARIVLAPSQWDEPFGRIAIEAMANGIPTLVSHAAGLAEIVGEGAQGVRAYQSPDAWHAALENLLSRPAQAQANAAGGREIAARFLGDAALAQLHTVLRTLPSRPPEPARANQTIALVGANDALSAFARMNAQLRDGLQRRGLDVCVLETPAQFVSKRVDATIHHDFTQEFHTVMPPAQGHWIVVRPWDFGKYPAQWAKKISAECDQLWVYSRWARQHALASGIPAARVRVIPPGIDPKLFRPDGAIYPLPTTKNFRFVFVGGAVLRKGLDILLKAYRAAFTRADDVCLVVKDNPRDVFYHGARIALDDALENSFDTPEMIYLDAALRAQEMAALYRACQMGVFPYRAEGFALPILEAMACGTPSIVPQFGACLDYCDEHTSFFVQAQRIHLPVAQELQYNTLGFRAQVSEVDFCEVSVTQLAGALRHAYALHSTNRVRWQEYARAGVARAHQHFTWQHTATRAARALETLPRTPQRFLHARRAQEKHRRVFEIARAMYVNWHQNTRAIPSTD
jgi:glycosyltransferase involved in cell wall biosynthesis